MRHFIDRLFRCDAPLVQKYRNRGVVIPGDEPIRLNHPNGNLNNSQGLVVPETSARGKLQTDPLPVNVLVASQDPEVIAVVDDLYAKGASIDMEGSPDSPWKVTKAANMSLERLYNRCSDSIVKKVLYDFDLVCVGFHPSRSFLDDISLLGTNDWVDYLQKEADPESLPSSKNIRVGDMKWVRLTTPAGVTAEARRIGRLEGDVLRGSIKKLLSPKTYEERIKNALQTLKEFQQGRSFVGHRLAEDKEYWSLRDTFGQRLAMAIIEDKELFILGPGSNTTGDTDMSVLIGNMEAVIALRVNRLGLDDLDESIHIP
jgi:hypothetical protein